MEILVLQVFVSLVLVAGSVLLFAHFVRLRDIDHADRLALIPVEDDDIPAESASSPASAPLAGRAGGLGTKRANERATARTNASPSASGPGGPLDGTPDTAARAAPTDG